MLAGRGTALVYTGENHPLLPRRPAVGSVGRGAVRPGELPARGSATHRADRPPARCDRARRHVDHGAAARCDHGLRRVARVVGGRPRRRPQGPRSTTTRWRSCCTRAARRPSRRLRCCAIDTSWRTCSARSSSGAPRPTRPRWWPCRPITWRGWQTCCPTCSPADGSSTSRSFEPGRWLDTVRVDACRTRWWCRRCSRVWSSAFPGHAGRGAVVALAVVRRGEGLRAGAARHASRLSRHRLRERLRAHGGRPRRSQCSVPTTTGPHSPDRGRRGATAAVVCGAGAADDRDRDPRRGRRSAARRAGRHRPPAW